jgi:hypothetical protein
MIRKGDAPPPNKGAEMPTKRMTLPPGHGTPGVWRQLGPLLSLTCLLLVVVGGFLIAAAQPETPNLFDKRWEGVVQTEWNLEQAHAARMCFGVAVALAALGLVLHRAMGARQADHSSRALATLGAIATVGAAYGWFSVPLS